MIRKLLATLFLGIALVWLVLSYLPEDVLPWRMAANEHLTPFFLVALIASALLFVLIQLALIASVFKFPQQVSRRDQSNPTESRQSEENEAIRIQRWWEFTWTAIPLAASVLLFVVSYCVLVG